jgi:sterol desaturase/sphingolipid hydroxylase (fatty acid hydroxylase superfamily)
VQDIGFIVAAVFVTSVAAELIWSRVAGHGVYSLKESLSNLCMMIVGNGLKPAATAWTLLVLSLLEPLQAVRMSATGWTFLVTFLVVDFAYYWYHRLSHELPLLWAIHHTHHSSPWMNLTTAVRLNWIGKFLSPLFFAPLVLLGLPATFVTASMAIGLLYQFPLHTRAIGRLGRFEGTILNTPSAHRVHHGSNARYIDRNYAGVFIIWDRLFGTYRPEDEQVRYGVTTGFVGHNPLVVQFQPLWKYLCGKWRSEKQNVSAQGRMQLAVTCEGPTPKRTG